MALIVSDEHDPETGLRPRRGAKLNRSETVTVRLDPRLNYLCELAARAQRRTKSSFIEWAVENALKNVPIPTTRYDAPDYTIDSLATHLWDVDEADRLAALAFNAPTLMTHEEQLIWKVARGYGFIWRGRYEDRTGNGTEEWTWEVEPTKLIPDRLREHYDQIKKVALGEAAADSLPSYERKKPAPGSGWNSGGFKDDLDDDVPF